MIRPDSIIRLPVIWNRKILLSDRHLIMFIQIIIITQEIRRVIQIPEQVQLVQFVIFVRLFGVQIVVVNAWAEICADAVN